MLCGPVPLEKTAGETSMSEHLEGFSDDYLQKYGGERNLQVQPGDEVAFPNGSVKWRLWNLPDSIVDLCEALSHDAPVLAYAYTEIKSDEAKMVIC
jgi:hypothetical protein